MSKDDEQHPKTRPMPSPEESTPTEPLSPLPVTVPLPADVPPRPAALPKDAGEPTQPLSTIGSGTKLPPQKRPATTRPKQLAWSNLPNSEPIPLAAVAGGIDVTGTHPTLPPASSVYTGAVPAAPGQPAAAAPPAVTEPTAAPRTAANTAATAALPTVEGDGSAEADAAEPAAAAPKRRRGHRALLVALTGTAVVIVVVGIAAAIGWQVAETHASSAVKQTVQQKVDQVFGLPASHPVSVSFQEPVLPQVWAGKLATLDIRVAEVPIAGSTGTMTVHATQVPTSGTRPAKSVDVAVRLKASALKSIVSADRTALGQILPGSVRVDGSDVTVALNPAQFLSGVSFTEVLGASVKHGALVLTPKKFVVGGLPMSADTVRARFGGLAQGILASRTVCLADGYPSGMTLTGLKAQPTGVLADFDVDPGILSDPALQAKGTCK